MIAIVIEDLKASFPSSVVSILFNEATSSTSLTPDNFWVTFKPGRSTIKVRAAVIIQRVGGAGESHPQAGDSSRRPCVYCRGCAGRYRVGGTSAQKVLVKELESLGARMLVISRNEVPFSGSSLARLLIQASSEDVLKFVEITVNTGSLSNVRDDLAEEVKILRPTEFFSRLNLCSTPYPDVKTSPVFTLPSPHHPDRSNPDTLYRILFSQIQQDSPWVLRLFRFLVFASDINMDVYARSATYCSSSCSLARNSYKVHLLKYLQSFSYTKPCEYHIELHKYINFSHYSP